MSINRDDLHQYLNELFSIEKFRDYCPNGLQVEGKADINKIIFGVTASQALIEKAIELKADAIFVHHGYFWKNEAYPIIGMKKRRISSLLKHDINLFAYHLPLDAHPTFGNNVQLAKQLKLEVINELNTETQPNIGIITQLNTKLTPRDFAKHIEQKLQRKPLHISGNKAYLKSIAICTGGAQGFIELAAKQNVDAYLSGEISENTTHIARETGIDYFAAGHHATERYGAKAMCQHLAHLYQLDCQFIDIDNPA